jgi:hypothetical protein
LQTDPTIALVTMSTTVLAAETVASTETTAAGAGKCAADLVVVLATRLVPTGNACPPCKSWARAKPRVQQVDKLRRATQTVTSTVLQTVTHIATQRATVVIAEIEISTAVSTIDVTISSAETQTNVIWATATAVAKRAVASLSKGGEPRQLMPTRGRLSRPPGSIALNPRQASQGEPPTVTNYVTQTTDTLSISSVTVTAYTTSTIVTTVYQTNTRYILRPSILPRLC